MADGRGTRPRARPRVARGRFPAGRTARGRGAAPSRPHRDPDRHRRAPLPRSPPRAPAVSGSPSSGRGRTSSSSRPRRGSSTNGPAGVGSGPSSKRGTWIDSAGDRCCRAASPTGSSSSRSPPCSSWSVCSGSYTDLGEVAPDDLARDAGLSAAVASVIAKAVTALGLGEAVAARPQRLAHRVGGEERGPRGDADLDASHGSCPSARLAPR